jgi:hypothetical protein
MEITGNSEGFRQDFENDNHGLDGTFWNWKLSKLRSFWQGRKKLNKILGFSRYLDKIFFKNEETEAQT